MPNSRSRNRDVAAMAPRRQPRQDGATADAGFPLGTVPRLPADAAFFLDAAGKMHQHRVPLAGLRKAHRQLALLAAEHPALVLEDKGMNLALHYRSAPELAATVRDTLRRLVEELGDDFELQSGKMVMEIKPSGKDKGTAIAEFLAEDPFRGRLPVFIGDDLTDEFGFELINRVGGCSVKVGEGTSAAHWQLPSADAVRAWLRRFLERSRENP